MGFFAPKCICCGKAILNEYTLKNRPVLTGKEWMAQAIVITPRSASLKMVVRGQYDGSGHVVVSEQSLTDVLWSSQSGWPDVYHEQCWHNAGEPMEFTGGSPDSPDQGFFIRNEDYADAEPYKPD